MTPAMSSCSIRSSPVRGIAPAVGVVAVVPWDGDGEGCVSVTGGVGVSFEVAARAVPVGDSTKIAARIGSAGLVSGIGRGTL